MENILITKGSSDYELLDSGGEEKLERYGEVVLSRPDPQALWSKSLSKEEWEKADAVFTRTSTAGKWEVKKEVPGPWNIKLNELTFSLKLLPSKHLGIFPEQSAQWKWISDKISRAGRPISVLNMFAYTGGASLACAQAGASVVHLDASKFAVDFAHENLKNSDLGEKPVRFIVDDVRKFIEREIKRGNTYDVVLMDPPVYGKGSNDEIWKIEEDLQPLLSRVKEVLSETPLAVVMNGYAAGYSHIAYRQMIQEMTSKLGGKVSSGELAIEQTASERLLPCGIFARWENAS